MIGTIDIIIGFLTIAGSLGLFLFGMKLMSESLQKISSQSLRTALNQLTSNSTNAVSSGFLLTSIIQSSSATAVLTIGFVNAGMLQLRPAIAFMMGANIGTTVTAWLISLLGFQVDIFTISIVVVGLTFPLLFASRDDWRKYGEFFIGFSILFLGINFMKDSVPEMRSNPEMFEFLTNYANSGFFSVLLFVFIGLIITLIIQSSSAAMALTLVMVYNGWMSFELAMAMVIGSNIGTTVTANLAAIVADRNSKIVARAHFLFNLFGAVWAILSINILLWLINIITIKFTGLPIHENVMAMPIALAAFHSFFNIFTTILLIGFIPQLEHLSSYLVNKKSKNKKKLTYISSNYLNVDELSTVQARKEIVRFGKLLINLYDSLPELYYEKEDKSYKEILTSIYKSEKKSDKIELEIERYLSRVSSGQLSQKAALRVRAMQMIINNLENAADICLQFARTVDQKNQSQIWFNQEMRNGLQELMGNVKIALQQMQTNIKLFEKADFKAAKEIEKRINKLRKQMLEKHQEDLAANNYTFETGMVFQELIVLNEKVADFAYQVSEAIDLYNNPRK